MHKFRGFISKNEQEICQKKYFFQMQVEKSPQRKAFISLLHCFIYMFKEKKNYI